MTDQPVGPATADDADRRLQDQLEAMRDAHDGQLDWANPPGRPGFPYLFDPDHVLVRTESLGALQGRLGQLSSRFDGVGNAVGSPLAGLTRYQLPPSTTPGGRDLMADLDAIEEDLPAGVVVTPDHFLHVSPKGVCCPATEPAETRLGEPWPPRPPDDTLGNGVRVAVVDTGWHPPAATHAITSYLAGVTGDVQQHNRNNLPAYAGHGTFVAGVVRCVARATDVHVHGFLARGGAVRESAIVARLVGALDRDPHVINLSAGARTRKDRPLLSFEVFFERHLQPRGSSTVLVAAAGNDGATDPFWPASFKWALGVGSLDGSGLVSEFSNHGLVGQPTQAAEVFTLGRNHVNAFPGGRYVCKEAPNKGDVRRFNTGLARWSGTSFASPRVAGLIAARMSRTGEDAVTAKNRLVSQAVDVLDPRVGPVKVLPPLP